MSSSNPDPALLGIWIIPGQPQTYEVTEDGGYHIADPEAPLAFEQDGAVMVWGDQRMSRRNGSGLTPIGTWFEDATGEAWDFTPDHGYSILANEPDGPRTFTGIWALRDGGRSLWTRERRASVTTRDGRLTIHTAQGDDLQYRYTVDDGVWWLLDAETGAELTRYVSAGILTEADAGERDGAAPALT